jgi:hypothetical protein
MLVTPNHRLWVKRPWLNRLSKNNGWKFLEAKDLKSRQFKMRSNIPVWVGNYYERFLLPVPKVKKNGKLQNFVLEVKFEDWAEFVGWVLSEGNISHSNKAVEISQSVIKNPIKYKRVVDLIERMGFSVYKMENKIKITSLQLYEIFKDMGKSHQKRVPSYLKLANKKVLFRLLEGLYFGDGTFKKGMFQNYITNSKQLADDIQECLMKLGFSGTIKKYGVGERQYSFNQTKPIYQISCSTKSVCPIVETEPIRINYKGRIYCVTVQNQIILTRRNGKAIWSGNSYHPQKIVESFTGGKKPNVLLLGHYHKAEYLFYRNVHVVQAGTLQDQTSFMQRNFISAHLGFWLVEFRVSGVGEVSRFRCEFVPLYD